MSATLSIETTNQIRIEVESRYHPDQSRPEECFYYFSYQVRITNMSEENVQLLGRHWIIENNKGEVEEVIGEGVVGQQPLIPPGHQFRYTSACPLDTRSGKMKGNYQMLTERGELFDAVIPLFRLGRPNHLRLVKS